MIKTVGLLIVFVCRLPVDLIGYSVQNIGVLFFFNYITLRVLKHST